MGPRLSTCRSALAAARATTGPRRVAGARRSSCFGYFAVFGAEVLATVT
ncbi:hypothetical protein EDF34_1004 [Cellulomonas sp. PhB150]|nr:hypothetical protein EDF34_1004 [Cellulomonas sp. PhB150]